MDASHFGTGWFTTLDNWKKEQKVSQEEEGKEYICYMNCKKIMAELHSGDYERTGRDEDAETVSEPC